MESFKPKGYLPVVLGTFTLFGSCLTSLYSYVLFHSIVEFFAIVIAFCIFVISWNSKQFLDNMYLLFIGIASLFVASIDLLHTLAYKGMGMFRGYDANLPTQLWIAARYVQSFSFLLAPLMLTRRLKVNLVFVVYATVTVSLLGSIFYWGVFPDCFIEGKGLTHFKKVSEYTICLTFVASLFLLYRERKGFSQEVLLLLFSSILMTIVSELAFTLYIDVYGISNLFGHLLRVVAVYFLYRALVETGLKRPYALLFRNLKQSEEALRKAKEGLESLVMERTAELRASEEKYRGLIQKIQAAVVVHGSDTGIVTSNPLAQQLLGLTEEQMTGKPATDPDWHFSREDGSKMPSEEYPVNRVLATGQPLRDAVIGVHRPAKDQDVWVLVSADPVLDGQDQIAQVIVTFVDITDRKRDEEVLHRLNRELRAISECNETLMLTSDEQTLLNDICRIVCNVGGYRMAWVGFAEKDVSKTIRPVAWAGMEDGYLAEAQLTWADTERGHGPAGIAIREGTSACIQDFTIAPLAVPWREGAMKRGYRSAICLPLKDEREGTFGVLCIYSTEPNAFNADEIRLLEELSGNLAFGILVLRTRLERNLADAALRESEEKYRTLFEESFDGLFITSPGGKILDMNKKGVTMFGYDTKEEMLSLDVERDVYAFSPDRTRILAMVDSQGAAEYEIVVKKKSGQEMLTHCSLTAVRDEAGVIASYRGIIRDITESKLAEQKAIRLAAIVQSCEDAIIGKTLHGIITSWNRGAEKIYGFSESEMIGKRISVLAPPGYEDEAPQILEKIKSGEYVEHHETLRRRKDGGLIHVSLTVSPIQNPGGRVVAVSTIGRDITERKLAEEQILKLNEELEQRVIDRTAQLEAANKELEAFAYSVSHDLRAPLRHIDGFLELLQKRTAGALDDRSLHYMASISDATRRMGTLIDDLLSFSRMGRCELSKRKVDLGALAQEVIREIEPEARGRVIRWHVADFPMVIGDFAMLRIVLVNLISNALKFTRPCPEARIEIGCMPGKRAEISIFIRDNGVGFDMNYAERLFEVFQRLHRLDEFEGTGIGLANVRRIISRHGGRTWAEGKVDQGATFYFSLPQLIDGDAHGNP